MADSAAKRMREAKKRQRLQVKAERKRLRSEGLLGNETEGFFPPGEPSRPMEDNAKVESPVEPPAAP